MRYLSVLLLVLFTACGDANAPRTGPNFAVINQSADPATVVLHQTDWDAIGQVWVERSDTAFALTVQPGVRTCETLNLDAVSGVVTLPIDTFALSVFTLAESNQWTVNVVIGDGPTVARSASGRGEGCLP